MAKSFPPDKTYRLHPLWIMEEPLYIVGERLNKLQCW